MVNQRKAGVLLGYVNIFAKNIVNLMYTPLLLYFLGQNDYGIFQMTNSVVFALTLLSAGFSGSYVRFYMKHKTRNEGEQIKKLNGMYMLFYIGICIICVVVGTFLVIYARELFHRGLSHSEIGLARTLMSIMVVNIAVTFLSVPFTAYISANEQFVFQQTRGLATTLAQPVCAVITLLLGWGAVGVSVAILFINIVLLLWNAWYALNRLRMRFTFRSLDKAMFKAVAIFSFWIFLNEITNMVNNQVPNFLLGALAGASVVTTYAIASQIRNLFFSLSTIMSSVFVPKINQIVATSDDNRELVQLMTRLGRYQMMIFWFIFGGFVLAGQFFVDIWAGEKNRMAYWLAVAMTLPLMVPLTQNAGIEIQRAKNRHKVRSVIYVGTAVLDCVISIALIPILGYWATAIGYIVSMILGTCIFMNWYYHTRIGLDMVYFWREQAPIIVASVLILAVCILGRTFLPICNMFMFIAWIVVYTIAYAVVSYLAILKPSEKALVTNQLRRFSR